MNDGEEPQVKSIMMLPDDMVLNILARVSRFDYPTLSLVSKRCRSLLTSTDLCQTRTLLGCSESCLYVCLQFRNNLDRLHWFILDKSRSKKVLVPISSPTRLSSVVAVGTNIYAIGGSNYAYSSSVMVMDSHSHTWLEAPSMQVARNSPSVCVLDGKIYVTGGCRDTNPTNWMEVFDTKTQTWEFLQMPMICDGSEYQSISYEGTVYVKSKKNLKAYKVHRGRWRAADIVMPMRWNRVESSSCVIENVFYTCHGGMICWYDLNERVWKIVKGLKGLPRLPVFIVADYGGKMAIMYEEYVHLDQRNTIWCAEIMLERRRNCEIWGTVEWFDNVFTKSNDGACQVHCVINPVW